MPAATSSKRTWRKRLTIAGAKPKTVDEIRAEYKRREFDLHAQYERELVDLRQDYSERLEALYKQRAAELAEVEDKDDTHQQTTN